MKRAKASAAVGLIERASGVIVPGQLAAEPEPNAPTNGKAVNAGPPVCYDMDGRRRVVFSKQTQKRIDGLVLELAAQGFGFVTVCREDKTFDGKVGCGHAVINEGRDGPDGGYGCKCSRIHFQG